MINHHTNALFFDNVEVPVENLIGKRAMGFRYIIDGWNAERILVAAEAIGDGRWFVERAAKYASERNVFGRADRRQSGHSVPHRQSLRQYRSGGFGALPSGDKVRPQGKMRRGSQSGKVSGLGSRMGSRQRLPHDARRLRLRRGIRRGTKISRDAPADRGTRSATIWCWPISASMFWECRSHTDITSGVSVSVSPLKLKTLDSATPLFPSTAAPGIQR